MPVNSSFDIYINSINIGSVNSSDGTFKEIKLTQEITSIYFQPEIRVVNPPNWNGYIIKFFGKYIPTQLKKKAWSFAIRADSNLRLLNGQTDARSGQDILSDVIKAWQSNIPIKYTDTDGKIYDVIVTDFKGRQPIIHPETRKREYIIPVELLET